MLINRQVPQYGEEDVLAATQSLLLLTTLLFFGDIDDPVLSHPDDAHLLLQLWDVKEQLAGTGLFLKKEDGRIMPSWKEWAKMSAKHRTIMSLNHLEWCWSLLHGYPTLTCFELGPLPAPAPGYLWRATDAEAWRSLYEQWLWKWRDGSYKMADFFYIEPRGNLDSRGELWLSEADEFGAVLMAEAMAILPTLEN
jgi:hypothetical protein